MGFVPCFGFTAIAKMIVFKISVVFLVHETIGQKKEAIFWIASLYSN